MPSLPAAYFHFLVCVRSVFYLKGRSMIFRFAYLRSSVRGFAHFVQHLEWKWFSYCIYVWYLIHLNEDAVQQKGERGILLSWRTASCLLEAGLTNRSKGNQYCKHLGKTEVEKVFTKKKTKTAETLCPGTWLVVQNIKKRFLFFCPHGIHPL